MQKRVIIIKIFLRNNNLFVVLSCDFSPAQILYFSFTRCDIAVPFKLSTWVQYVSLWNTKNVLDAGRRRRAEFLLRKVCRPNTI